MNEKLLRTPRQLMEAEKARVLKVASARAAEIDRDMVELERIVSKYGLLVIAPQGMPPPAKRLVFSNFERAQKETESLIRVTGRPMRMDELFPVLIERGIELGGREPTSMLSGFLKRNQNLRFIKNQGWWLADVPWPPPEEMLMTLETDTPVVDADRTSMGGDVQSDTVDIPESYSELKRRRREDKDRTIQAARDFLKGMTEPVRLRSIYDHVVSQGINIPGADPKMYLSEILRDAGGFRSHKRSGWTLVDLEPLSGTEDGSLSR